MSIGAPIDEANDDGAIVRSVSDSSNCMAGNALMNRAGRLIHHAMDFISDASYQKWVKGHYPDQLALVAYLATGVRSSHVQSKSGGRHWIDDPATVCVEAIDWLLSKLPFAVNENGEISGHSTSGEAGRTDATAHNEQDALSTTTFDTFLSHNSQDKPIVRQLADALVARGLRPWLDERELVPGRPWQEALEDIIQTTKTAVVMFGPAGLGPWEEPEMRACLSEFVKRKLPVIPVLLPGAPQHPDLPLFLKAFTWVDLRG
ncbi:MAG: toll/interleukin-1 receptor domain-containing protein, partial [Candidatus Nealsonbacteria bacterium]|nr:toll/interleukin-1 receptor domain-containing protein [Candidatus Nealsonbacteria bacterium]